MQTLNLKEGIPFDTVKAPGSTQLRLTSKVGDLGSRGEDVLGCIGDCSNAGERSIEKNSNQTGPAQDQRRSPYRLRVFQNQALANDITPTLATTLGTHHPLQGQGLFASDTEWTTPRAPFTGEGYPSVAAQRDRMAIGGGPRSQMEARHGDRLVLPELPS